MDLNRLFMSFKGLHHCVCHFRIYKNWKIFFYRRSREVQKAHFRLGSSYSTIAMSTTHRYSHIHFFNFTFLSKSNSVHRSYLRFILMVHLVSDTYYWKDDAKKMKMSKRWVSNTHTHDEIYFNIYWNILKHLINENTPESVLFGRLMYGRITGRFY